MASACREGQTASCCRGSDPDRPSSVDEGLGKDAGSLLGRARTTDPIDAPMVLIAEPGDRILTSDPDDK
jgi:hypothetical protein